MEPTNPDGATPSDSRATALRPLAGPAWGAVAAAGALTTVLLGRLPAHWAAYQALAAHVGGAQGADFPGALYDARPGLASFLGEPLLFGAFLACLATWVLRARRNAGALRPDHPFRFSPTGAVAGVLVPLGNLWFAGPVVTEIADACRPAALRGRRPPERAWWTCGQVAVGALVATSVVAAWTPLGRQGPVTDPLPTSGEVTAQLAVALLNGVAVAALAAMTALLAVTLTRIGRDQRHPAASAPEAGDPPVVPHRGLAAGALVGATTATATLIAMTGAYIVELSGYAWASALGNPYVAGLVVIPAAVLAVNLAQIGALGLAAVRFARRRRGSAVALTAAACAVAWARILLGTPPPGQYAAQLWWANPGAALVCIGTAVLVVAAVRRPAHAP